MRVLSLDGGGYLGLATASFLQHAEGHFGTRAADQFDLFCGTSTGAIIALALANGMSASDVLDLYERIGREVFPSWGLPGRAYRWARGFFFAKYGNAALRAALDDTFGDTTIGDLHEQGAKILVTAFNLSNGRPRIFKTDHAAALNRDAGYRLADIALASSAAPTFLPIVTIQADGAPPERFCDGGLFANHPALLGYAEAVHFLKAPPNSLKILSISTPRVDHAEHAATLPPWRRIASRGLLSWGDRLVSVPIDSTATIAHSALGFIASSAGATYERVELNNSPQILMDVSNTRATRTLMQIGADAAHATDMRRRLAPFLQPWSRHGEASEAI